MKDSAQEFNWTFDSGEGIISSEQINISSNETTFAYIASDYWSSGVFRTNAAINSTAYSDTEDGVVIIEAPTAEPPPPPPPPPPANYSMEHFIIGEGAGTGTSAHYNITFTLIDQPVGEQNNSNYNVTLGYPYYKD